MRIVLQRSKAANVTVEGRIVGAIQEGLVLLVGFTHEDNMDSVRWMADKVVHLRIFEDEDGKMNQSLLDVGGEILSISQFTLYGDVRKGRRPNFMAAARPEQAELLYHSFNEQLRAHGVSRVATGQFGAMMDVSLINSGPVTLVLENNN